MNYILEYRKNILFIKINGEITNKTIYSINIELDNLINNLCIYNIVFNFEEVTYIDESSVQCLKNWNDLIRKRKGVNYICSLSEIIKKTNILNYIYEISNELCAMRVINWNN